MTTNANDAESILRVTSLWSARDRLLLAQRILDQVLSGEKTSNGARWQELAGLATIDGPVPDDHQVAAWLEEHRLEKYG